MSMEVAKSVEDGIEDFARFLSIERRSRCGGCRTGTALKGGNTQVWNKRNDEPTTFRPQGEPMRSPAPTPIAPAAPAATTSGPKQSAVIGPSMTIKGEIRAREELLVEGEVEGLLESQNLLTVGPNGKVLGNIKARRVAIFGSVRGNVEVTEKIAIREQGSLIGDIKAAGISIDDGAYFKGSVDIVRPEPKVTTKAAHSEPRMEAHSG
jgi:cytoskeletal protein CcmA (bactofilin family)